MKSKAQEIQTSVKHWGDRAKIFGAEGVLNVFHSGRTRAEFHRWQLGIMVPLLKEAIEEHKVDTSLALDFGCGSGRYSNVLAEIFQQVVAYDQTGHWLPHWQPSPNVHRITGTLETLGHTLAEQKATFVWTSTVLQHISEEILVDVAKAIDDNTAQNGFLFLVEHTVDERDDEYRGESAKVEETVSYCWHRHVDFYKALFPMFDLTSTKAYSLEGDMTIFAGFRRKR